MKKEYKDDRAQERFVGKQPLGDQRFPLRADGKHVRQLGQTKDREDHGLPVGRPGVEGPCLGANSEGRHEQPNPDDMDPQAMGEDALFGGGRPIPQHTSTRLCMVPACRLQTRIPRVSV